MNFKISQCQKASLAVFLLFIFTASVFGFSFKYRNVDFKTFQREGEAGYIVLMRAKNWYNEGPTALKFALYNEVRTVENQDVFTKDNLYGSFLPGQIVPVYLVSRLLHEAPTVAMLVATNLVFHFFTAFILSVIVFFLLRQLNFNLANAFCFSLIPACLEIFLPGPFALHHISYFNEHLSILPFTLFILLEIIIDGVTSEKQQKVAKAIQGAILFGGVLISWFFVFVALVTYSKRILLRQFKKFGYESFYFWLPIIIGVFLFFVQQFLLFSGFSGSSGFDVFASVTEMFFNRAGLADGSTPQYIQTVLDQIGVTSPLAIATLKPFVFLYYFYTHSATLYGHLGFGLSVVSLVATIIIIVFALIRKRYQHSILNVEVVKILSLICLTIFPVLIWAAVFRQQISLHEYELLKAGLFVALVPFVLIPVLAHSLLYPKLERICGDCSSTQLRPWLIAVMFVLSLSYVSYTVFNNPPFFTKPPEIRSDIQRFILDNTAFEDIVFTTIYSDARTLKAGNFDVTLFGPTNKRLYEVYRPGDIYRIVKKIDASYTIDILTLTAAENELNEQLVKLLSEMPREKISSEKLTLYKIKKEDFLSLKEAWQSALDELVINGDFDTSLIGWATWPNVTLETTEGGFKNKALKIKLDATASSGTYQAVSAIPGKSYTLTFYQKNGNTNSTYCFGSTLAGQEIKACEDISNIQWKKYSHSFTSPGNTLYIQFYTRSSGIVGDFSYIDEVSLK